MEGDDDALMSRKMYFILGVLTVLFVLPTLYSLGLPSFDAVLIDIFGEGSILALIFSLFLILFAVQGYRRLLAN